MELEVEVLGLYEVEKILKRRKRGSIFEYYVKWKNYPMSQSTWEPKYHLKYLSKDLDQFDKNQNKKKKKPFKKRAKIVKEKDKSLIRKRNELKISSYLMDKDQVVQISDDLKQSNSSYKLEEEEIIPEPKKQAEETYVIDIATEENGNKMYKIFTEGEIMNFEQKQAKLLFPRQVCLYYSKLVYKLLRSKMPIE